VKPILPPPPEGVLRISAKAMESMLEKRIEPVYPADAVALDARGMVLLLVTVRKTGQVGDVQVVSGPERFRDAATSAVKQWHYRPYVVEGEAVDVQTTVTLNFAPPAH
jgi:protein TonB